MGTGADCAALKLVGARQSQCLHYQPIWLKGEGQDNKPAAPSTPLPPQPSSQDPQPPTLLDRYVALERKQGYRVSDEIPPAKFVPPQKTAPNVYVTGLAGFCRTINPTKIRADFWAQNASFWPRGMDHPGCARWHQAEDNWVSPLGVGAYYENKGVSLGTAPVVWPNLGGVDTTLYLDTGSLSGRYYLQPERAIDGIILSFKVGF